LKVVKGKNKSSKPKYGTEVGSFSKSRKTREGG